MDSDKKRKIERLISRAEKACHNGDYLKIPIEMALYALQNKKVGQVQCYIASQFLFSGKARTSAQPADKIAEIIGKSTRTVYRYFEQLIRRDWFGIDKKEEWYFFRGFDRIYEIENWTYRRAGVIQLTDLKQFKAFCIGVVLASMAKTGKAAGTERFTWRSQQPGWPISLKSIRKLLECSKKTAFTYRKLAKKRGYIKMRQDLLQVEGLTAKNVRALRKRKIESIEVSLFGLNESISIHPKQLIQERGLICAQMPNIIYPCIALKKR